MILLVLIGDVLILPFEITKELWSVHAIVLAITCLALAGGLGHAAGLNGLILRNIRYPGTFARLLFG